MKFENTGKFDVKVFTRESLGTAGDGELDSGLQEVVIPVGGSAEVDVTKIARIVELRGTDEVEIDLRGGD